MSRHMVVMQRPLKLEGQSPVKIAVLKPSNAENLQNIPQKNYTGANKATQITSKSSTPSTNTTKNNTQISKSPANVNKNSVAKLNGLRLQRQVNARSNDIKSSPRAPKSPFKALTPKRPSPPPLKGVCTSASSIATRSPSTATNIYVRTPTSVSRVVTSTVLSAIAKSRSPSPAKCKRRIAYNESGEVIHPVSRRNARERNRVKMVSQGFALLRQHVPQAARKKKLSKVETLRCAVEYIRGLQLLLDDHPPVVTHHPLANHHPHLHPSHPPPPTNTAPTPTTVQYQQLHPQVFLHPQTHLQQHHNIEPHILKLPVSENPFQNLAPLRYDETAPPFLKSPTSETALVSPTENFFEQKFTPPEASPCESIVDISTARPYFEHKYTPPSSTPGSSVSSIPSSCDTSITSSSSNASNLVTLEAVKAESEENRAYGPEEQDLLEALAWWQHNTI